MQVFDESHVSNKLFSWGSMFVWKCSIWIGSDFFFMYTVIYQFDFGRSWLKTWILSPKWPDQGYTVLVIVLYLKHTDWC